MQKKNYYDLFLADAQKLFSAEAEQLALLKQQFNELRESLKLENANIEILEVALSDMKASGGASISSGKDVEQFKANRETFKNELIQLKNDLDNSRELTKTLTACIPVKRKELESATHRLQVHVDNFVREKTAIADDRIRAMVIDMIDERKDFLDCFDKIYSEFGISFVLHDQ